MITNILNFFHAYLQANDIDFEGILNRVKESEQFT